MMCARVCYSLWRSSAAPTRHGRVIGATKSVHPELGSLPIVVPIDEAVRRTLVLDGAVHVLPMALYKYVYYYYYAQLCM